MYCYKCGAQNPEGATFCGTCGSSLSAVPAGTPPPAAGPPPPAPLAPPGAPPPPAGSWPSAYPTAPAYGPARSPAGTIWLAVGVVFIVLAFVAAIVAFFLSEDGAYEWSAGIYLLAAILFGVSGMFLYVGRTR